MAGTSLRPASDLPPGTVFWRLQALRDGQAVGEPSPPWQFHAPWRSGEVDTSFGNYLDFNGDGYSDAAFEQGRGPRGHIWVLFGSPNGLSTPQMVAHLPGEVDIPDFPFRISGHDYNGDGLSDLIGVQAPINGNIEHHPGRILVFLGEELGPPRYSSTIRPTEELEFIGFDVASGGDLNRDGYGELIVSSSPVISPGGTPRLSIFYGSAMGLAGSAGRVLRLPHEERTFAAMSWDLGDAADLDGDGFEDLSVAVYFFQSETLALASQTIWNDQGSIGAPEGALSSREVEHLGPSRCDLNGDGRGDTLLWPRAVMDRFDARRQRTTVPLEDARSAFACQGDMNGDGRSEILAASRDVRGSLVLILSDPSGSGFLAPIGLLSSDPLSLNTWHYARERFGGSGDFDGDGHADFLLPLLNRGATETDALVEIRIVAGEVVGRQVVIFEDNRSLGPSIF